MIKRGIKNYFKSLKYFFTPLGALFLGMMFGLSVAVPLAVSAAEGLLDDVKRIVEDMYLDPMSFLNEIFARVNALDWSNPFEALSTLISAEWIENTLVDTLYSLFTGEGEYAFFIEQFTAAISLAGDRLYAAFAVLVTFAVVGAVVGFLLTKLLIRHEIAKRTFWRFLLGSLADCVTSGALFTLSMWLADLWAPSLIFSSLAAFVLFGTFSLAKAYFVHGFKKVKIGEVVTLKNAGLLILTNLLIYLICGLLVVAVILIFNVYAAIVIALVLWQLASIVISLNAEAFVKSYAEDKCVNQPQQINKAAA